MGTPQPATSVAANGQGRIHSLIVKVASRCNLNCTYCYVYSHEDQSYARRPKFMSAEVYDAMLARVVEYCDRRQEHDMALVFHGGEPTLMGPERFEAYVLRAREALGGRLRRISMQTNATLIDEHWLDVLGRLRVPVAVSLDGPPQIHDQARIDHAGRGSYEATVRGMDLLSGIGIAPHVLCVVQPGESGLDAYRHFVEIGVRWMTFLLPDVSHDNKGRLYGSCGATPVADYLLPIFDEWFARDDPGIQIGLFWDLLARLLGGTGDTDCFGNPLMSYVIVETDGEIEALDALRVCEDGVAASGLNVRDHGFDDLNLGAPLVHQAVHDGIPLSDTCQQCDWVGTCGGGFLPHRYARANGFDNPSVWCADIKLLLERMKCAVDGARAA